MDILTTVTIQYLNAQIAAGVDGIQIFESWATAFSFDDYKEHAFPYLKKIVDNVHNPNKIPITLFCRNTDTYLPLLLETNATTISVDWSSSIQDIATTVPANIALQGNLNPDILLTDPDTVQQKTNELLEGMQGRPGHIVNLGHGITPKSKEENVAALVDTVKEWQNVAQAH